MHKWFIYQISQTKSKQVWVTSASCTFYNYAQFAQFVVLAFFYRQRVGWITHGKIHVSWQGFYDMGFLPDTQNRGLRMRRECRERFPRHRIQRELLISDPGMHHGTCVTHVPWCMSGSLNCGSGGNFPGNPGACATRNFAYLARGPWLLNRCWTRITQPPELMPTVS